MLRYEQQELLKVTADAVSRGALEQNQRETLDTYVIGEYNGWSNYPTWAVNLWLSNDEPLYRETFERITATIQDRPHVSQYWTDEQTARYNVADMLKDWVTNELAPDLGASFAADLLGYALDEVDWNEIATAWINDSAEVGS